MNAEPELQPKPRRRRWIRWGGGTALLVLLLVALAPTLLSTGWGKGWVETKISQKSGMRASIGELSLGWWSGAKAERLRLEGGRASLHVERLQARFSVLGWLFGSPSLELEVDRPEIVYRNGLPEEPSTASKPGSGRRREEPGVERTGKPKPSTSSYELPFRRLRAAVRDGKFAFEGPGGARGALEGIQLALESPSKRGPVDLKVSGVARPSGGNLSLQGSVDLAGPAGSVDFLVEPLDLAPFQSLFGPQLTALSGTGEASLQLRFEGKHRLRLDGRIRAKNLQVGVPAFRGEMLREEEVLLEPRLSLDPLAGRVEAEGLRFSSSLASLEGKGAVSTGAEAAGEASLSWKVDVEKFPPFLRSQLPPRIAASRQVMGEIRIRSERKVLHLEGFCRLAGLAENPQLAFEGTWDPERKALALSKSDLSWGESRLSFRGEAALEPDRLTATLDAQARGSLGEIRSLVPHLPADPGLGGLFEASVQGRWANYEGGANLRLEVRELVVSRAGFPEPLREKALRLECGNVQIRPLRGEASVETLSLTTESQALEVKAKGSLSESFQRIQAESSFRLDAGPLAPLLLAWLPKDLSVRGKGEGSLRVQGKLSAKDPKTLEASAELAFPECIYAESRWTNGRARLAAQDGLVRLAELQGEINGRPFRGSGSLDLNPPKPVYEIHAECVQVPLRQGFLSMLAYPLPFLASKEIHLLRLSSELDGKIALRGEGFDGASVRESLSGEGRLALGGGTLAGPAALGLLMVGGRGAFRFDGVEAPFQIAKGKVRTPGIVLRAGETTLTFVGATGLDGSLDYAVQVALPPRLREEKWGRNLEALFGRQGLPVGLGGRVDDPKPAFKMPELKEAGKVLLEEALDRLKKKKKE